MNHTPTPRAHPPPAGVAPQPPPPLVRRNVAHRLHLQPGHPGFLVAGDEERVLIDWTDASGVMQHHGHLDADWLEVVSEQQHQRARARLQASDGPASPSRTRGSWRLS